MDEDVRRLVVLLPEVLLRAVLDPPLVEPRLQLLLAPSISTEIVDAPTALAGCCAVPIAADGLFIAFTNCHRTLSRAPLGDGGRLYFQLASREFGSAQSELVEVLASLLGQERLNQQRHATD